jgi:hypothetical protein
MRNEEITCDCTIYPFQPNDPCFDICSGKIIHYAKNFELLAFFSFTVELADKLFMIASDPNLMKLSDFKPYLTAEEFEETKYILSNIEQNGKAWLKIELRERIESDGPFVPA